MCEGCREYDALTEKLDGHLARVKDAPGAYCVIRREEVAELREFLEAKKQEFVSESLSVGGW